MFIDYLKKAHKQGWAIGQFNVSNMDELKGVLAACKNMKSPAIIGTSEGESGFFGMDEAVLLINYYNRKMKVPLLLNLDHGHSFEYIKRAIDAGYPAVHFDGSRLPIRKNIEIAKKVREYSRKRGVIMEGEMDAIHGSSGLLESAPKVTAENLTDPKEARKFVDATKVNSLALSIGTFHGQVEGFNPKLDFNRLKEIKKELKDTFLVLHGGSGVSDSDFRKVVSLGITKINVNTELRVAYSHALAKGLAGGETTPYKYMPSAIDALRKVVEKKIKLFGSFNKI